MSTDLHTESTKPQSGLPHTTDSHTGEVNLKVSAGDKLKITIDLAANASVDLDIQKYDLSEEKNKQKHLSFSNPQSPPRVNHSFLSLTHKFHFRTAQWPTALIGLVLAVYLITRFIGLDSFPIYFFTDEAIQTVHAAELVQTGFLGEGNEFLPTYLINGGQYNLSTSVYIQVLPYLIFGKSIWVTRGICVLFSLLAALAVGLISRNIFNSPQPYLTILLLSITPAWFLHSRTAFETALAVSFYAAFLCCYLMYRKGSLRHLYAAAAFAALTFYSYSPAQLVIAVSLAGVLFSDLRYHWQNRKTVLIALSVGALFTLPYVRFLINHPTENVHHLEVLHSYWIQSISLFQKLGTYFGQYLQMIDPRYWFMTNGVDLQRHLMKGYGNLLWWVFPLVLIGLVISFIRIRKPEYRVILIAIIAAPSGAALASAGITRVLFMVIPAAVLTGLGLDQVIKWLGRVKIKRVLAAGVILALLMGVNGYMVYDALVNAPTWYNDYGLYGMQYGARQVFGKIKNFLQEYPESKLMLSSDWANGTDTVARFFFDSPLPFQIGNIDMWLNEQKPLDDNNVFVITPEEMKEVYDSPKFKSLDVLETIPYPNGKPGFYFVKVAYPDNIAQILEAERLARRKLIEGTIQLPDGTKASISYPMLDMGKIQDAFDGNPLTLIRGREINPLILTIQFDQPYSFSEVAMLIGSAPSTINIEVAPADGSSALEFNQALPVSNENQDIVFSLNRKVQASQVTISLMNTNDKEPSHVHLWEVTFK